MSRNPTAQVTTGYGPEDFRAIAQEVARATGTVFVFEDGSNPSITIVTNGDAMNHDDHSVTVGRDNCGQAGQILKNCSNIIKQQAGVRRGILEELGREVNELIIALPEDKKGEAAGDFELMLKGATSAIPNRRWYEVSAKGILDASKWVKDFTGNIAGAIGSLGRSIWPDFSLPESAADL